ncbi:hypothetical protein EV368DRAFT_63104 [Lentinula lateritia]|nr:hypothetical protein EV368DRAFT_63104 [Lentinula lateritia]
MMVLVIVKQGSGVPGSDIGTVDISDFSLRSPLGRFLGENNNLLFGCQLVGSQMAENIKTSPSVHVLKSCGHSTTFNLRNLEHDWYPVWNGVFTDIKSLLSNVNIYPQYFLWLQDSKDLPPALRQKMLEHLDPNEYRILRTWMFPSSNPIDGDTSFGSTITITGSEKDLKPDFSFMHLTLELLGEDCANSAYATNRANYKILHECHFAICEVKGVPSRHLSNSVEELDNAFYIAQDDLGMYANMEEVPAWDWVTGFSRAFELCTPESDQEINHLITHYFQPDQIHEQVR